MDISTAWVAAPRWLRLHWLFLRRITAGRIGRWAKVLCQSASGRSRNVKIWSACRRRRAPSRVASGSGSAYAACVRHRLDLRVPGHVLDGASAMIARGQHGALTLGARLEVFNFFDAIDPGRRTAMLLVPVAGAGIAPLGV